MRLIELWAVRMPDETDGNASQIVEHHDDMSTLSLYGEHLSSPHDKIHSVWTTEKEAIAAAESLLEARRLKAKGCDGMLDELIQFVTKQSKHLFDEDGDIDDYDTYKNQAYGIVLDKLKSLRD